MWTIEINIAGLRYTLELPARRRRRFPRHNLHWPATRHSPSHAA